MFGLNDEDIQKEAREVARKSTNDPTLQKFIEGNVFRIKKLEEELTRLRTNFWILIFILFILPLLLPRA